MVATWTRDTPWRQGHFLTPEAALALGLSHTESPYLTCVVVISHDCDLANEALQVEPDIEVIVGRRIQKGDGNYFWAKAPRTLHIDAQHRGSGAVIELVATAKRAIPKQVLAAFTPDTSYKLPGKSLSALRSWLGAPWKTVDARNSAAAAPAQRGRGLRCRHRRPPRSRCVSSPACLWRHSSPAGPEQRRRAGCVFAVWSALGPR